MSRFLLFIMRPFKAIRKNKTSFWLWAISTLFMGNLGLFINMVIRGYSGKTSVLESFQYDFMTGSLYLFSIVLLASSFGSILIDFTKEGDEFKQPKTLWFIFTVIVWFFCGLSYSGFVTAQLPHIPNSFENDWGQWLFFFLSLFLSVYAFCLLKLDSSDQDFAEISDKYEVKEKEKIEHLEKQSSKTNNDGNGNKL